MAPQRDFNARYIYIRASTRREPRYSNSVGQTGNEGSENLERIDYGSGARARGVNDIGVYTGGAAPGISGLQGDGTNENLVWLYTS